MAYIVLFQRYVIRVALVHISTGYVFHLEIN